VSELDGIVQVANKPNYWLVPSGDGKRTYEVHGVTGSCECKDYVWRRANTYDLCRHGRALKAHLDRLKACPSCGGRGFYVTQFVYASGNDPLPCSTCDGTGKREGADPRLVALFDGDAAERREAEWKAVFA
jgi:hypothetical protein